MFKITAFTIKKQKIAWLFFVLFMISNQSLLAQNAIRIKGKIEVKLGNPGGILIVNLSNEHEAKSDQNGFFEIEVSENDLLIFSANHIQYFRKIVEIDEIKNKYLEISIEPKLELIEEVEIVHYEGLDAVSLGIIPKKVTPLTIGQRLQKSGGGFVSSVRNIFDGSTKRAYARVIETEKFVAKRNALKDMFDELYFVNQLKISEDKIDAFIDFALTKKEVQENLFLKNKFLVSLYLSENSRIFNQINDE